MEKPIIYLPLSFINIWQFPLIPIIAFLGAGIIAYFLLKIRENNFRSV